MTFNLDEYWPMEKESIHSYHRFMRETFFDHVNIPRKTSTFPTGRFRRRDVEAYCDAYEQAIEKAGGIDLQILGIGRTGHIGFNEPGSPRDSRTRMVTLDPGHAAGRGQRLLRRRERAALQAITMGVGTILAGAEDRHYRLGEHKAPIVRRALEEPLSEEVTASFLQTHRNVTFALDLAAASDLTAMQTPLARRSRSAGIQRWKNGPSSGSARRSKSPCSSSKPAISSNTGCTTSSATADRPEAIRQRVFNDLLGGICTRPAETSGSKSSFSARIRTTT